MAVTKSEVRDALNKPNGAEALLRSEDNILPYAYELFRDENMQAAAGYLAAAARRMSVRKKLLSLPDIEKDVAAALGSDRPKMRKNAARLAGELRLTGLVPALEAALGAEDTAFVRPSIILALGALDTDEARAVLAAYTPPEAPSADEETHRQAELDALNKASGRGAERPEIGFTGLKAPEVIELRCPMGLTAVLAKELKGLGYAPFNERNDSLRVKTDDLPGLFRARCFFEALVPIGRSRDLTAASVAAAAAPMAEFVAACHDASPVPYRIELKEGDRSMLSALPRFIADPRLVNSPSAYAVELRVECGRERAELYVKFYTCLGDRFEYRKRRLPASIHPATAAAVLRFALPAPKKGARVLDPCCGSGTLLVERAKLGECELFGVDRAAEAIRFAAENAAAAGLAIDLVKKDLEDYDAVAPFDEVVANLPFGIRVGTHAANEAMYAKLLDKLPVWLVPGGVAVLYTMEFTLMKRLIRERPSLTLTAHTTTGAGGLLPGIFVLRVK